MFCAAQGKLKREDIFVLGMWHRIIRAADNPMDESVKILMIWGKMQHTLTLMELIEWKQTWHFPLNQCSEVYCCSQKKDTGTSTGFIQTATLLNIESQHGKGGKRVQNRQGRHHSKLPPCPPFGCGISPRPKWNIWLSTSSLASGDNLGAPSLKPHDSQGGAKPGELLRQPCSQDVFWQGVPGRWSVFMLHNVQRSLTQLSQFNK